MSSLSTLPKGDSAWLLRKAIERIIQQVSVLETNIGSSTTGNSSNTQVIFNDNGTLRGDPDLIFNTSQNKLVATALESTTSLFVGTSATITGDLTAARLIVTGGTIPTNGLWLPTTNTLEFSANSLAQYRIAPLGVFSWYDGAGGTRMTLNSTGLGIGAASPSNNLHIKGASGSTIIRLEAITDGLLGFIGSASGLITGSPANNIALRAENGLYLSGGGNSPQFILNSSGNVGVGVTPSAWGAGLKALQVGATGYGALFDFNNDVIAMSANLLWTGSAYNRISASSKYALAYYQDIGGSHQWAMSSAAGTNAVAPTMNTLMTLNANGNLVLKGGTAAANGVGVTFPATQVASSDANCLDDYEEGDWTIGLEFGGASTGMTTNANTGKYTKIGRQVTVTGYLALTNKGSATGDALITGLPFLINSYGGLSIYLNAITFADFPMGYSNNGTSTIPLRECTNAGVTSSLTDSDFANNSEIIFTMTYNVA